MDARDQIISNLDVQTQSQAVAAQESAPVQSVLSIVEKLNSVTVNADGSVSHNIFLAKDGSPRKFKDEATHKKWVTKHLRERREDLKTKLSPV